MDNKQELEEDAIKEARAIADQIRESEREACRLRQEEGWCDALIQAYESGGADEYMLQLKTGVIVCFRQASSINPGWVHLFELVGTSANHHLVATNFSDDKVDLMIDQNFIFSDGMDVRLSDIVWVAQAPYGHSS